MKIIIIERWSPVIGGDMFGDKMHIVRENHFDFVIPCRTTPNPYENWRERYGCLAPCQFDITKIQHGDRKGDFLFHNGGPAMNELPSIKPNPNHNGKEVISEVFIHRAYTDTWPGSAGCITVQPVYWDALQKNTAGETNYKGILKSCTKEV